jgi:hypothetical protein
MANNLSTIFAFAAFALLMYTLIRTRKRIKCIEIERNKAFALKREPVEDYNEAKVVKLVDVCRELEARVQNKASLLEALIDDAQKSISKLESLKSETPAQKNDVAKTMYDRVLELKNEGKNEEEIGVIMNRTPSEVKLLLSLGRQSSSSVN